MLRFRPALFAVLFLLTFAMVACSSDATVVGIDSSGGATGPQEIQEATEILKFDPASIPLDGREPVSGTCGASAAAPGAYRCELADASVAEPCFVLSDAQLLCDPDPVAGDFQTLVDHAGPLPQVPAQPLDRQVHFFVELADGSPARSAPHRSRSSLAVSWRSSTAMSRSPTCWALRKTRRCGRRRSSPLTRPPANPRRARFR